MATDKRREQMREAEKRYRNKNRDKLRAKSLKYFQDNPDYKAERRQDVRAYVRLRKLSLGCIECGYNKHHAALDWHHKDDDKETCVGQCESISAADREMAKCVVICANCHRAHHYDEYVSARATFVLVPDYNNPILD
jgi:hypothetical protein